jgi:hypothetical protein
VPSRCVLCSTCGPSGCSHWQNLAVRAWLRGLLWGRIPSRNAQSLDITVKRFDIGMRTLCSTNKIVWFYRHGLATPVFVLWLTDRCMFRLMHKVGQQLALVHMWAAESPMKICPGPLKRCTPGYTVCLCSLSIVFLRRELFFPSLQLTQTQLTTSTLSGTLQGGKRFQPDFHPLLLRAVYESGSCLQLEAFDRALTHKAPSPDSM